MPQEPADDPRETSVPDPLDAPAEFRPTGVRVLAVAWWVLAAVLGVDLLLNGDWPGSLAGVGLLALTCAVVLALFWLPAVRADRDGVELVNVWRTVRLPWALLEDLDTRWALNLDAAGRRWTAWAAPASGRRLRPVSRRETPWAHPEDAGIAGSRAPGSSAGEAAVLVETRWRRWQGLPGHLRPEGGQPRVTWNVPVLAAVGGATALLLVGLLVGPLG